MSSSTPKTEAAGPIVRALVALAEPMPDRALVLDDDDGELCCALAERGVAVTAIVATDRQAAEVRDRALARNLEDRVELRVGDPLGPWGLEPQRSLFELRDASANREARLFEGRPWPLVVADVRSGGLTSDERRRLRPWFESARGHFPREVVLIERASRMTGDGGRLLFACRPDLFGREFGTVLSERILAPRGPHLVVDARTADPPRVAVAQTVDGRADRAIRPRMGIPRAGRWDALIDGIRDTAHPWVDWREIPSGLSDPADALDSQQSRDLLAAMDAGASGTAEDLVGSIPGRTTACGFRDVWVTSEHDASRPLLRADGVRDWQVMGLDHVFWPYDRSGKPVDSLAERASFRLLQHRPLLEARKVFGDTIGRRGLRWYEHAEHYPARIEAPHRVVCSTRGTHNHAAMLHQSPVLTSSSNIVLAAIDEDAAFLLLALLNSSLVCFWAKHAIPSGRYLELTSTQLMSLPIPALHRDLLVSIGRKIDRLARQFGDLDRLMRAAEPERLDASLESERAHRDRLEGELVWWQEELDWAVYAAYGLVRRTDSDTLPRPIARDERAFLSASQHPGRSALIEHDPRLRAIERPNYKRPFDARDFDRECGEAAERVLMERLLGLLVPGIFVPVASVRTALLSDPAVSKLVEYLELDEAGWIDAAIGSAAMSMNPTRFFAESGWTKYLAHVRRCLAASRREAGDHGDSTNPVVWNRDDFVSAPAWRTRGRNNVQHEQIWLVEEMTTFEGEAWMTRAPTTWAELRTIRSGYDRLLHEFGFYLPDDDAEDGATASIRMTRAYLDRMIAIGVEGGFGGDPETDAMADATPGVDIYRSARGWVEAGAPRPADSDAIQLDLDRLVGIRELVSERSQLRLRQAREHLAEQGWSARDVRLALDSLVDRGEVVSSEDPRDPSYEWVAG